MIEQGVVRVISGKVAEVEIVPASPEACASCGSCEGGPTGRLLQIEAGPGMAPGTRVVLDVSEPEGLGPVLVVFLLPVLALLIGAMLGSMVPEWTGWTALSGAGFGFLGAMALLVPVILVVRWYDRRVAKAASRPRVISIQR